MNELYSIEPRVLLMLRDPAVGEDNRRIAAVIVLIEEVHRQTGGAGYKPREMLPFLQCAIYLLGRIGGAELGPAREHASAACELLTPD
jgi:hypothetical protein